MTLLTARALVKDFGGLRAVDHVDFKLEPGEIRAVIGPNGAGKTTLVSLISGRLRASSGEIEFGDRDITRLPAHSRVRLGIAYTFQITSIFPTLSLFDNVALAVQRRGGDLRTETMAVLERVGLAAHADATAGIQSYGHQRLLELAMGLALQPRLLILDEPTQGLSEGEIASFTDLVRDLAQSATILLIEHNMDVVMSLAQTITVMDRGAVLAEGPPEAIRNNEAVQAAYLGQSTC